MLSLFITDLQTIQTHAPYNILGTMIGKNSLVEFPPKNLLKKTFTEGAEERKEREQMVLLLFPMESVL